MYMATFKLQNNMEHYLDWEMREVWKITKPEVIFPKLAKPIETLVKLKINASSESESSWSSSSDELNGEDRLTFSSSDDSQFGGGSI